MCARWGELQKRARRQKNSWRIRWRRRRSKIGNNHQASYESNWNHKSHYQFGSMQWIIIKSTSYLYTSADELCLICCINNNNDKCWLQPLLFAIYDCLCDRRSCCVSVYILLIYIWLCVCVCAVRVPLLQIRTRSTKNSWSHSQQQQQQPNIITSDDAAFLVCMEHTLLLDFEFESNNKTYTFANCLCMIEITTSIIMWVSLW